MLEPGETEAIVHAIADNMNPVVTELDSRLTAVELRIANIEPRIAGQVGAQMEPKAEDDAPTVDMARWRRSRRRSVRCSARTANCATPTTRWPRSCSPRASRC
jgi:hypothetical protein